MKNRLKELRKIRSWSQADLARALNISRQAVNGFESGKFTPSLEMAFKIALLFDVPIESVFIYREKIMQGLLEKVDNFIQWLPRGEKFTDEAISAIEYARCCAGWNKQDRVEPRDLLCGLMRYPTATASLLAEFDLGLNEELAIAQLKKATKVTRFSPESKYVLELALNAARLKQSKQIGAEFLLLALIQLNQLGNDSLLNIFQNNQVDVTVLTKKILDLNS